MSFKRQTKASPMRPNAFQRPLLLLGAIVAVIVLSLLSAQGAFAQQVLTLEEAIQIAQTSSPDIKKSRLNLYSNRKSLDAQRLAMKSRFGLDVTPFDYNRTRLFNDLVSRWNTNEDYNSFANFSVFQPIAATDGTVSLINRFGYRDNYSEFQDVRTKTYSNNLYLQI
ncbi:MAG: TolC family protein, partial [Imperialibacter sp.]